MDKDTILKLAKLLLDLGKSNPLVNFRDRKSSTLEFITPDYEEIFNKLINNIRFEVFNPNIESDKYDELNDENNESEFYNRLSKQDYIDKFANQLKKNQLLPYSLDKSFSKPLKLISKKAKATIQETGVNISYLAFGFIHWKESEESEVNFKAPILLVPVEISNNSLVSPFYISAREDEAVLNPTFSYKLANEFNIELPEFDGVSISRYFDIVENILGELNWTVSREVKLGNFSFLKINMYRDLLNHADIIAKNTNIQKVLDTNNEYAAGSAEEETRVAVQNPMTFYNVVDADSSQLEAIAMAKSGKSFVLQGPPGTGKSQTITNIIAECMANGKKVLFVSEKLAALEVVYDKLKKAGLDDFCLQLHSYKANKKDVVAELARTLKLNKNSVGSDAEIELTVLRSTQAQLENYERELHKRRNVINMSLYSLFERHAHFKRYSDMDALIPDIKTKDEAYISNAVQQLNRYAQYSLSIGYNYKNNPWYGYIGRDNSYQAELELKQTFLKVGEALKSFKKIADKIESICKVECDSLEVLKSNSKINLMPFLQVLGESDFIVPQLLNRKLLDDLLKNVVQMKNLSAKILEYKKELSAEFDKDIYEIQGESNYKKLKKIYSNFFKRLFSKGYKEIQNSFRICRRNGKQLNYKKLLLIAQNLSEVQKMEQEYREFECAIKDKLGIVYNGYATNWEHIILQINACLGCAYLNEIGRALICYKQDEFLARKQEFSDICNDADKLFSEYEEAFSYIDKCFDKKVFELFSSKFSDAQKKIDCCLKEIDKRNNWINFYNLQENIKTFGLMDFIDDCINNNINMDDIAGIYQKLFYKQWIDYIIHTSEVLNEFNRATQDQNVSSFMQKDKLQLEINKAKIKAIVSAKRPELNFVAGGSAISTLLREAEKKRKHKPIRLLLKEIGELAQILKPCFMMSPLSVSTFLDSEELKFDTIIFDEASQIFPQDAIGAIYRGKQLIVVGDSKQMPPSNFFNSMTRSDDYEDEENEAEEVSAFESILDLCSASMPQIRLRWHYRSRFEELIAFSNKNFYDGDLISFPSARVKCKGYGVAFHYVNGIFDRKTKTNRAEADYIVDLIYKHFEQYPNRSLGVVAFSVAQQDLIERVLTKRRMLDQSKEEFFKENLPEPFFIKNLETVQGDERDTIIFSIAYARDIQGRFMANFGPVNRLGGERRLNVAVTRAKYNIELVSSIHAYDIDLKGSRSEGAKLLREYVDFAENGMPALQRTPEVAQFEQFDSDFEMDVYDFLVENGFSVDTQVGCSKFRIDLALKRPNTSDYVLAIECDGATYHSSAMARDRDRLRQQILENMGWKFYRIWSTDWFKNNRVEKERLLKVARETLDRRERAVCEISGDSYTNNHDSEKESSPQNFSVDKPRQNLELPEYELVDEKEAWMNGGKTYLGMVAFILKEEAPLSEEWLLKRTVWMFKREKVTGVVRKEYNYRMYGCEKIGIIRKDGFLYISGSEKKMLRAPGKNNDSSRDIQYISLEELANGLLLVIQNNVSVNKDGLFKEIISLLGLKRRSESIENRLNQALRLISDLIEWKDDLICLKN